MPLRLQGRSFRDKKIYLVIAISGRAIAQGLKANNLEAVVVDGFNDLDTCSAVVHSKKVERLTFGLNPSQVKQAVSQMQEQFTFDGVLYDAAIEVNPNLLDDLAINPIIGNNTQTLRTCKVPDTFFSILDDSKIPYPDISLHGNFTDNDEWLVKNAYGTGGIGVQNYDGILSLQENIYYQKKLYGISFSLLFLANGKDIKPLGFNEIWSERLSDTLPYVYSGAINTLNITQDQQDKVKNYAKLLAQKLKLVGLNSLDCILFEDIIYVLEINARIPATYELYETKNGELLKEHMHACINKQLTNTKLDVHLRAHMIVYAPHELQIPGELSWPLWTADRPHVGETILQHEPICNVFAGGKNSAQVRKILETRKITIINKITQLK